jgi:hypothetical protein
MLRGLFMWICDIFLNTNFLIWVRNLKTSTFWSYNIEIGSCGSVVGIATRYGLDSLGIESRWSQIFRAVHTGSEDDPPSYTMGTGSFPWVRPPKRVPDLALPFSIGLRRGRSSTFTSHLCLHRYVVGWRVPYFKLFVAVFLAFVHYVPAYAHRL